MGSRKDYRSAEHIANTESVWPLLGLSVAFSAKNNFGGNQLIRVLRYHRMDVKAGGAAGRERGSREH